MINNDLIGTWILVSHVHIDRNGVKSYMPATASGMLIYGLDGSLSVLITKRTNPDKTNDIIAYSGNYTAVKNEGYNLILKHKIVMSLHENRKGTSETRLAELKDGFLILETEKNEHGYYIITWRR